MGNKSSSSHKDSSSSLNPNERRRLTTFLESRPRGSRNQFDHGIMQNLWEELLTPNLLQRFTTYLMKQDVAKKNCIGVEEFVALYSNLVRGTVEEKALTLADLIGSNTNSSGQCVVSYKALVKYLSELLESYFLGLKSRKDAGYNSWTHLKQPEKHISQQIMVGITTDLTKKGDEVDVSDLEKWLRQCGVVSVLHTYVLGSMYNLEPDVSASIIPQAILPTQKTPVFLDLSQVAFLNTYLPQDHKETWRFLFSTSSHGESFSKFVGCIVNQGPLLLVIESNDGSVFGGFISENINLGPKWVGTGESFLYQLRPSVEVYPTTGYNNHYSYLNTSQSSLPNGLGMGGQHNFWGLFISSSFGEGECSESCTTYKNYKQLCNTKKFKIVKLEAWAVGEQPLSAEEMGERAQPSILDKDPTTSHILEMAGRKVYSKGLREENPET